MNQSSVLDELTVVKRSGQRVSFNKLKIAIAIKNSFDSIDNNYNEGKINQVYESTIKYIEENYKDRKTINVEDIQDIIEYILKEKKILDVYKSFSEYRTKRNESRNSFSQKQQHKFGKVIEKAENIKDESEKPNIMLLKFGRIISKEYTKAYLLDNKYERAINEGKIYIHNLPYYNLGYLSHTNLNVDNYLLDNSFHEFISFILNAKNEIAGEILLSGFDSTLSSYLTKKFKNTFMDTIIKYLHFQGYDNLINVKKMEERIQKEKSIDIELYNYKDIFQNEMLYRLFSISYNDSLETVTKLVSNNIKDLLKSLNNCNSIDNKFSISIGNTFSKEEIVIRDILIEEISLLERLDNVSIIYKLDNTKENIDVIYKIASLITNNKNVLLSINKNNDIEYFSSGYLIYDSFPSAYNPKGRLNVVNTSVNMARIVLKYKKLNKEFYNELDEILELIKNELKDAFEYIGNRNKENYQILFNNNIYDDEKLEEGQKIRKVLKGGSLNINLSSFYEAMLLIDGEKLLENASKVIKHIYDYLERVKAEYHLNYTLSVVKDIDSSKEFMNIDKTVFGIIKDITDKDIYSNIYKINTLDNLKEIEKQINYLNGGSKIEILLSKNSKIEKVIDTISKLSNNIGLVDILIGDKK